MRTKYLLIILTAAFGTVFLSCKASFGKKSDMADSTEKNPLPECCRSDDPYSGSGLELPIAPEVEYTEVVNHIGYTTCFNWSWQIPMWVAYEITAAEAAGEMPRMGDFCPDPEAPHASATTYDYRGSGYDRGHMAPAGDMKWSEQSMLESFYMSNICPQNHNLNDGRWKTVEKAVRRWAGYSGSVYVVCGPIADDSCEVIGDYTEVIVPRAFFKVVCRKLEKGQRQGQYAAIGFVFPNEECYGNIYDDYSCTVDSVEALLGYDFFSLLPDSIEDAIESAYRIKDWNY